MRRRARGSTALACALVALAACADGGGGPVFVDGPFTLWWVEALPEDLSTDIPADGELILSLFPFYGGEVPDEVVAELAGSVTVRTASGQEVPVIVEAVPRTVSDVPVAMPPTEEERARSAAHVSVRPVTAWEDTWHTVSLWPVERVDLRKLMGGVGEEGRPRLRFRAGPELILQRVEVCDYAEKGTYVDVWFSAPIEDAQAAGAKLALTADGVERELVTVSSYDARKLSLRSAASGYDTLVITLTAPILGADGAVAHLLDGRTVFSLTWPEPPGWFGGRSSCPAWTE